MEKDSHKQQAQYHNHRCKIPEFFQIRQDVLPKDFERYLDYYKNRCQVKRAVQDARRILSGFNIYLQKSNIDLHKISIEKIDSFLSYYNKNLAQGTCKLYRAYLRGFLRYLYQQGHIRRDLAALVVGPPEFTRSTPLYKKKSASKAEKQTLQPNYLCLKIQ
ncbi:site-specific integrase [Desulfobacula sp.]|uniref:site-specific integrase n=1 Tax=Desulfobacula sp. TaxID=2593537 RepID=UPI001ED12019|nr:phage integrase SAM-like domain-containing protein [Desulfobacula sp.]